MPGAPPNASIMVSGRCVKSGVVARDSLLSREADRREARMLAEFPTVAELLAESDEPILPLV